MNNYVMALFTSGTTNFDYMGLGPLSDAISAVATETATSNGNITYTMEMSYPINGHLASQLTEGNLIKAQVSKTPGDYMIFEINETLKSDDRTITVYCDAYANRILRMSFDNGGKFGSFRNVQDALNAARAKMTGIQSDFKLTSGIGTRLNMSGVTANNKQPTIYQDFNAYLDAIMENVEGNVRFGINSIQIVSDRGRDITDTVLRDDKNTNGISIKVDTSNIINRIIPMLPVIGKDGNPTQETKVGKIVTSSVAFKYINFYAGQVVSLDNQDLANSYFNRTHCDRPTTTATVQTSMLDEDLTDVRLFDRITVYSNKIGYQAKLRVSERDFDILAGAVSEFKLGSSSVTVFNSQTGVINAINSAVQSSQYAVVTADGKNTAYYEGSNPNNPKENDLWFHSVNGISQIDQYVNGNWITIVSDSTGEQIRQKVGQLDVEAKDAVSQAKDASEKASQLSSRYDDTNALTHQAIDGAVRAQSDASSAVAAANSTASEFGKVSQKTDSAVASALNAQSNASDAVKQASSAAADSKDAKQIAGAVSQSYKTLTDGSTMTIAELESGLAVKLTKTDLDGYATQTWTQNQVKMTADGINGTMSSIKGTVDSHTTSINDLKADSSSFKSQFTTVNNTLGKQTTDIGSLQASSKELTTGFNTLTSDNKTNKNDISQLKQTSTELSSTMGTVQTQVQNSAVGTNLIIISDLKYGCIYPDGRLGSNTIDFHSDNYIATNGATVFTFSSPDYVFKGDGGNDRIAMYDSDKNYLGYQPLNSPTQTLSKSNVAYIRFSINSQLEGNAAANSSDWLANHRYKLEKGSVATDYSVNPAETATLTAVSKLSQTVDGMQADISKKIEQKDLNGYATQTWAQNKIQTTADGINATVSSVKTTVDGHTTSINNLQADSNSFKSQFTTFTNTLGKQTTDIGALQATSKSLGANFDSLSSDNKTNKHDIGQLQASSKTFNSMLTTVQQQVTDSAVGTNIYTDTQNFDNLSSWWGSGYWTRTRDTVNGFIIIQTGQDGSGLSQYIYVNKGDVLTYSAYVKNVSGTGTSRIYWQLNNRTEGIYNTATTNITNAVTVTDSWRRVSGTTVATSDGYLRPRLERTDSNKSILQIAGIKVERGWVATDYSVNPTDNATIYAVSSISQTVESIQNTVRGKVDNDTYQSKITELSNQVTSVVGKVNDHGESLTKIQQTYKSIDLMVSKDNVVNAINISPEGIQVYGRKLHITADTYIDNAVIKNSMIESLNAGKITAGTIDADKIQVIHLNATNITTGIINGSNLTINLNNGNVEFKAGRIHSSDNTIDIDINSRYISVADGKNRILLSGGELQMIQPQLFSRQTTPYFRLTNEGASSSYGGATLWSRDYIAMTVRYNDKNFFSSPLGVEKFAGISAGNSTSGWEPTKIGGAERGIFLSGGREFKHSMSQSPFITIGAKNYSGSDVNGSNVVIGANYLYVYPVHRTSHAANVYIAPDGALVTSTSAAKYKTDINRSFESGMGDKLLEVPVAHWKDKDEILNKTRDPNAPEPETYFGMIADDLDDAGLTELVEYDLKGRVRGIQYDRVALSLIPLMRKYRDQIARLNEEVRKLKEG